MTSISITDDENNPQLETTSIKDKTIHIVKEFVNSIVSLSQDKFLARELLIQNFKVIARLQNPDRLDMKEFYKVPGFLGNEFLIFRDD